MAGKMVRTDTPGQMLRWTKHPSLASLRSMQTAPHARFPLLPLSWSARARTRLLSVALLLVDAIAGCASGGGAGPATAPSTASPSPSSGSPGGRTLTASPNPLLLPAVPEVRGAPIDVRVRYPADNHLLATRDSNFVLGSLGSGDVSLSLNGVEVPVAPNGAFLAYVVNPPADAPRYDLRVVRGADTVRRTLRVRFPTRSALPIAGRIVLDSGSLLPASRTRVRPEELVRVSVRAPANAALWVETGDGMRHPMVSVSRIHNAAQQAAAGKVDPLSVPSSGTPATNGDDAGVTFATDLTGRRLSAGARIIATRGADSARLTIPALTVNDPDAQLLGMLRSTSTVGADTDRVVNARTIPDGTYKWLLHPGTVLEITGRQAGYTRVQLDPTLDVWVANEDIVALPEGSAIPRRITGGLRVNPAADWVDLAIAVGDRPAFLVEPDGRTLVLTLYGVQANPSISPIIGNDTLIRRISWDQVTSERVRITLTLSRPVYGWLTLWDEARRAFVLRVRRAPNIDPTHPLRALTIAVDPGHPPEGATGPTGLYEGDAVLPVGRLVVDLLRARGANPVLTRATLGPVGLTDRAVASRRLGAHAFVSIHLNALPDGVNPFSANGTSTLFYHQHSEPLARYVERELVARFGLRDLGVHYQNLAVARPSWYPAVLTEGLFIMLPEQEAAMRDPAFQLRYAEAIVAGLEAFFRELAKP